MSAVDIGPQYPKDPPFTSRMRLHQSWFRSERLGVPCGTGPKPNSTSFYGNMLRLCDGDAGLNFITSEAFAVAQHRAGQKTGAVDSFRLFHNMLSSMPMCFNLFGPFAADMELATQAFRLVLGSDEVGRVRELLFEYAPYPKSEYLDDNTAFDAFVSYERPDGSKAFLGIETKLTETFSRERYDKPPYRRWTQQEDSPWPKEAWSQLDHVDHNQLWRGHLLAVAMTNHPDSPYDTGRFAVVRHPGDAKCASVVGMYRGLVKPQDQSFLDLPLDRVIGIWEQALPTACADWLATFRLRYLDLEASEAEWELRRGPS